MENNEILQVDFYDLCGCGSIGMTNEDKIKYWKEAMTDKNNPKYPYKPI